jgi:hypothetical protein
MGWECRYNEGYKYCIQISGVYIWKMPISKSEQERRSRGNCEEGKLMLMRQDSVQWHIMIVGVLNLWILLPEH